MSFASFSQDAEFRHDTPCALHSGNRHLQHAHQIPPERFDSGNGVHPRCLTNVVGLLCLCCLLATERIHEHLKFTYYIHRTYLNLGKVLI
jgi:hypothetical protein